MKRVIALMLAFVVFVTSVRPAPVDAAAIPALLPSLGEVTVGLLGALGLGYLGYESISSMPKNDITFSTQPDWENSSSEDIENLVNSLVPGVYADLLKRVQESYNNQEPEDPKDPHPFGKWLRDIAISGGITYSAMDQLNRTAQALKEVLGPAVDYSMPVEYYNQLTDDVLSFLDTCGDCIIISGYDYYNNFFTYVYPGTRFAYYKSPLELNRAGKYSGDVDFYAGPYAYSAASPTLIDVFYRNKASTSRVAKDNTISNYFPYSPDYGFIISGNAVSLPSDQACIDYINGRYTGDVTPSSARDFVTPLGALDSVDKIYPVITPDQGITLPSLDQVQQLADGSVTPEGAIDPDAMSQALQDLLNQLLYNTGTNPDPDPDPQPDPDPDPEPEPDPADDPETYESPGLESVFPFCIPFDLIDCFKLFSAPAKAPRFEWNFKVDRFGINETIVIDLAPFEPVAVIFRTLMIIAFVIGLIMITRNLIGS